MNLPHIELLDTFSVWRDYFNQTIDVFNAATTSATANTLVLRDATGSINVANVNFVGSSSETLLNKTINAANNTLILSLNTLQDVEISGTPSNNQVLTYSTTVNKWIVSDQSGGGGGGSSYTNSDVDTHLNTGSATSNQLLSWNGSDYAWTNQNSSYTNSSVDAHLNTSSAGTHNILKWDGSDYTWGNESQSLSDVTAIGHATTTSCIIPFYYANQSAFPNATTYHGAIAHSHSDGAMYFAHGGAWNKLANYSELPTAYTNSDVDTHLNTGSATANNVLSWNGSDYAWTSQSSGGGSSIARSTVTDTTGTVSPNASTNMTLTGFKSYHLLKIQVNNPAWVTIYTSSTARSNDSSRNMNTDPSPGSGVIAEAIQLSSGGTVVFSPAIVGWNDSSPVNTDIYLKIVSLASISTNIQVTLTIIQIEA